MAVDSNDVSRWFGEYLDAFAACGRGETDTDSLLGYYGVPLLITTGGGFVALTSGDQVVAAVQQQVDGMRAAAYDRSEILDSEVTVLNSTSALYRGTDQKGFRILVRDPFWIFGSQAGSHPGWCFLVPFRDGLGGSGPLPAEDLVHGRGAGGERGPDLVAVDGLGDRCAAVAHQVADVLDADTAGGQDGHERVP